MTDNIRQILCGFCRVRGGDEIPADVEEGPTFNPQVERLREDLPTKVPLPDLDSII